jgi:glucosyl-dolichyl phosphate glucuronosyltransferase
MKISVILCTLNRCKSLGNTLETIAASRVSDSVDWEVLVIDNNSNDNTRDMVESFCRRYPGLFRYLFEPNPGKSYALNTGIRDCSGDVLAFVDDDVAVEPTWLQNLTAGLADGEWVGAGGRTLLAEEFSLPPWLGLEEPYNLGGAFAALFDLGDKPRELERPPYGANMAFRREMFERYGGFRTDLGPSPRREIPRPNEDTEFGNRLLGAGERLRYEPSAVVYHPIVENRVHQSYFLAWYFDFGRAMVREWRRGPNILGIPRRCFTFLKLTGVVLPVSTLGWMVTRNPRQRFFRKCWARVIVGQIFEIWRQRHNANVRANNPRVESNRRHKAPNAVPPL